MEGELRMEGELKMRLFFSLPVLLLLRTASVVAADEPPDWARKAASAAVPSYPARVTSVMLFHEESLTMDPDGRRTMRERGVIKLLQTGEEKIEAVRYYNGKSGRIRDFAGWMMPPGGKASVYAKNRILDVAASRDNVYDEYRAKILECGCPAPGSVFAWEVTEEEKSVFTQDEYSFQRQRPALLSRYVATLPAGWEAKGTIFNHDQLEPQVSGNTYNWELHDLPWIEKEDHSPSYAALAPRLAVSYYPPAGNPASLRGLRDWAAVSSWLSPMVDPPADVSEPVRARAMQLAANASTEIDRIRSIAAFVQQTNYVEVDLNLTRGGGYTPRRAEDTLIRNYGDCKDKATLMRSLLSAVGIESYLTVITAGDRTYVRPEWASPRQFNHAIVAIHVSDAVTLPSMIPDSPLGRLLLFDPTDPITALGDLPAHEQGSYALVIAGPRGALLKMPVMPAAANKIDSSVDGEIGLDGKLEATIQRQYLGQSSVSLQAVEKLLGKEELKKRFERGFTNAVGATTLKQITTETHPGENRLSVRLDIAAERFGESMQGRLFVVRPGLLANSRDYFFRSRERTTPIQLESDLRSDAIRIKIPAGYKADEIPAGGRIEGAYGSLQVSWAVQDGFILMDQTLQIRQVIAPPSDAKVRDFFDHVSGAQAAAVILVKQ
jgi:hypothetical protein